MKWAVNSSFDFDSSFMFTWGSLPTYPPIDVFICVFRSTISPLSWAMISVYFDIWYSTL